MYVAVLELEGAIKGGCGVVGVLDCVLHIQSNSTASHYQIVEHLFLQLQWISIRVISVIIPGKERKAEQTTRV